MKTFKAGTKYLAKRPMKSIYIVVCDGGIIPYRDKQKAIDDVKDNEDSNGCSCHEINLTTLKTTHICWSGDGEFGMSK